MDIRNFFSRKRKHSDDNEEGDKPVKKKRKLTTQTIQENKKQKEEENKEESTNTNTKNDVIPSIESLEINKEHDEEKCESESESEDDDYITNEENTNNSNKNTNNTKQRIPSIALSKTKESSLKESFKYDIINECGFKSNNKIEYIIIANLFDKISSTTKRLEKIELISRLFRSILLINGNCENQKECEINLLYSLYLCCNELGPPYKNIELGIGDSIILKALCERSKQNTLFKPKPLTINLIFETLKKIATISGSGTQQEKVRLIQKLIVASKSIESKYIVRHLQGKLRIGVNEQTVLSALGRTLAFHELKIYNNKNKKKIKNYEKISELENKYTYLIKQAVDNITTTNLEPNLTIISFDASLGVEFINSMIKNSFASLNGSGAFIKCAHVCINNSQISGNRIHFNKKNKGDDCATTECYQTFANKFEDTFGANGAGIYLDSTSMIIINNTFSSNSVNIGNGAGLFHIINKKKHFKQQNNIKMIIKNNNISNNDAYWNITQSDREPECTDFAGLSGFAGGFWLQIAKKYNSGDIKVSNNRFINNRGLFISHLYYDVFYRDSLDTLALLYLDDKTNIYGNVTYINKNGTILWKHHKRGSNPINVTHVELMDGGVTGEVCSEDDHGIGCIGYVLPGATEFRTTFKFYDYFGQTSSPFLSCSHLIYELSNDLELKQLTLHNNENYLSAEFEIREAEYGSIEYINISDTHLMLTSNINHSISNKYSISSYHVIATLCAAGQEVTISTEGVNVCKNTDMTGVSFKCGRECGQQEYLFTQWEPHCHDCPSGGVSCSGENIVIIDYANYAKVTTKQVSIATDTPDDSVCEMQFKVYLCPAELCCTNMTGCSFNGFNKGNVCAENRDPEVNFCGQCLEGYSEVIGSSACQKCTENHLVLILVPIIACFMLEIYFILRNPFVVTPLFTFVYKSLLYFYQILPILTYESYLSLVMNVVNIFDLSVLTSFGSTGTCLIKDMTAHGKLWVNFIIPLILAIELFILYLIPIILDWFKSRKSLAKQLQLHSQINTGTNNTTNTPFLLFNDEFEGEEEEEEESQTIQFESSYDPTMHESIYTKFGDEDTSLKPKQQHKKSYELIRQHLKRQEKFDITQRLREHYMDAVYNTLLIMYIVVCESSIKMFNCAYIDVDNESYLWWAGNVKCYTWKNYMFIFMFCILLLFPVWIIYQLWKLRGNLSEYRRIKFAAFTMSYRRKCWYYEAVMMLRRIILISVYAFPKTNQYLLRAIISFFCGGILAIHVKVQPFRYKINNWLETLLLMFLFLVSTLSTVSDTNITTENSDNINPLKLTTSIIAIVPLLFLPYLAFRYCRDGVVPKVKNIIVKSKQSQDIDDGQYYLGPNDDITNIFDNYNKNRKTDDYNEYIAPKLELISQKNSKIIESFDDKNIIESFEIKHKRKSFLENSISKNSIVDDDEINEISSIKRKPKYSSLIKKYSVSKTTDAEFKINNNINSDDDDMYKDIPLKKNQEYLVIGDDGQIELALFDKKKEKQKINNENVTQKKNKHKKKDSWYNNMFGNKTNRERTISKQYQEAEKYHTKQKQSIHSINNNNENDDNHIVNDLFLSPSQKRKKAAERLQKQVDMETQMEMAEFKNSTPLSSSINLNRNKNDSIDIIFQSDHEPRYNSIGSHTIFSLNNDIDDDDDDDYDDDQSSDDNNNNNHKQSITNISDINDIGDIEPTKHIKLDK